MSYLNGIPKICLECRKYTWQTIHGKCTLCQDLEIREEVLCNLNRQVQNIDDFHCYAFIPSLKLVNSSTQEKFKLPNASSDNTPKESLKRVLESDRIKYLRALVVQKLDNDPDLIYMDIRYHFTWNVRHRRPVFSTSRATYKRVNEIFLDSRKMINSFINLLWLAPDHVHLYVESDGDKSADTLAQEIKQLSESQIASKAPDVISSLDANFNLWDIAYAVETIG